MFVVRKSQKYDVGPRSVGTSPLVLRCPVDSKVRNVMLCRAVRVRAEQMNLPQQLSQEITTVPSMSRRTRIPARKETVRKERLRKSCEQWGAPAIHRKECALRAGV